MPPLYTDAGYNAHKPAEICTDSFQADRGPEGGTYVTPQLKGLWSRSKRGFSTRFLKSSRLNSRDR